MIEGKAGGKRQALSHDLIKAEGKGEPTCSIDAASSDALRASI